MSHINFNKEYNKLLNKINEYKTEYEGYLRLINIKSFVHILNKYGVLTNSDKVYFNRFFNMFVIVNDNVEQTYVPYISECSTTIKRKVLLKYLHPDKIKQLYGNDVDVLYGAYFTIITTQTNQNQNTSSDVILQNMCKENEPVFDIVTAKLLQNKLLSNNKIKSIKSTAKNQTYYAQQPENKYDVYKIFPTEIQSFVYLYGTLQNNEPIARFISDVYLLLSSIFTYLNKACKTQKMFKLITKNKLNLVPNLIQYFKLIKNNDCVDVMLALKNYLPNCYIKMIELFPTRNTYGFSISDPIFVRKENFSEELTKDFVYSENKRVASELAKVLNTYETKLNNCSIGEQQKIQDTIDEIMISIKKLETIDNDLVQFGINELSNISQFEGIYDFPDL